MNISVEWEEVWRKKKKKYNIQLNSHEEGEDVEKERRWSSEFQIVFFPYTLILNSLKLRVKQNDNTNDNNQINNNK